MEELTMTVKELEKGDFFTKRKIQYPNENQVWVRGEYDRSARRYECHRFSDINDIQYIPGNKVVFCEFMF